MAPLISPRSLAPSLSLFFLFLFSFAQDGRSLYLQHCADCHHERRIGKTAPPLIPEFLRKKSYKDLFEVIRKGIPATTMPAFRHLSKEQIDSIIAYITSPADEISYTVRDIERSHTKLKREPKNLSINNLKNLVVAVDKGAHRILLLEGTKVLDSFSFKNVHGGVKFSEDRFFVPARDGHVVVYSLTEGRPLYQVRACVYMRNIALSPKGVLIASCILPPKAVLLNTDLKPIKEIKLPARPGAVYELSSKDGFVLTFRDLPKVAFISEEGKVTYRDIDLALEDFFIDPFEKFIVGSSRTERKLSVYRLDTLEKVFEKEVAMPHLFSAGFWYSGGNFYFATRHIGSPLVSIWKLYDWELVKSVDTGSEGFFVRTSPAVPHLWIDNGDGIFTLLDKRTLRVEKIRITDSGVATHVEFTPDGRFAYLSVVGKESGLLIYNPLTLKPVGKVEAKYPAGKYNYVLKSRKFYPYLLGYEVFMNKCWGCHHQREEAFGPPFRWIAKNRTEAQIVSQMLNPEETSKLLGYRRNAMPRIPLTPEEVEALIAYIKELGNE